MMSTASETISLVIIDDNPLNNEFVTSALAREGLKIYSACDPMEGLALVQKHHPKIAIVDLALPVMNGFDAARILKRLMPTVPLIMYSAFGDKLAEKRARLIGISEVV